MKILKRIVIIIIISIIAISHGIYSIETYAAKNKAEKAQKEETIETMIEKAKAKHPKTLVAGAGMTKLNRSPRILFKKAANGKIKATVEDGIGIEKIIRVNAKTKTKKEIAGNKKKEQVDTFDKPAKNKEKTMIYTVKDTKGLASKIVCKVINKGSYDSINVNMRDTFSYNDGYLNVILRDNDGIDEDKVSVEIIDKNTPTNKSLGKAVGKNMTIADAVVYNGKKIYGVYKVDINRLTRDKDKQYFIQVKTTDASGNSGYRMAKFSLSDEEIAKLDAKKQKQQQQQKAEKEKKELEEKIKKEQEKQKAAEKKLKEKMIEDNNKVKKETKIKVKVSDKKIEKTIEPGTLKATVTPYNGCHSAQAVTVSEKYYIATLCRNVGNRGAIKLIDKETGKVKKAVSALYGHANGITYNSKTNKLYIAKLQGGKVATLSLSKAENNNGNYQTKQLSNSVSGIAYDPYTNEYYTAKDVYIRVYNSKFKKVREFRKKERDMPQDIGAYKGLILVVRKDGSKDYIDIYRNTGKYLGYYKINTSGELESVAYDEYNDNFVIYINYPNENKGRIFTTTKINLEDYVKQKTK